jgi:DNA polymerase-3 subunit gamma/tau
MTEQNKPYELHIEYRPLEFDEYIGNAALKASVLSVIDRAHTYIFYGPRGCGKTTMARLIAKKVGAADIDIYEIDAADKTGVDDARQIKANSGFAPMGGKSKVYIIDEFHRLSGNASDALLKTLEEPPDHCYFILCTTEIEKVPATIKSRAKSYEVKSLTVKESEELLDWVCSEERIKLPSQVRQAIIDNCEGIPREMLVSLDMVRKINKEEDAIALILSSKSNPKVIDLCRALLQKAKWAEIGRILKDIADEPENVRYAVLGYMNAVLLKGDNKQAIIVMSWFENSFMYSRRPGLTAACYRSVMD